MSPQDFVASWSSATVIIYPWSISIYRRMSPISRVSSHPVLCQWIAAESVWVRRYVIISDHRGKIFPGVLNMIISAGHGASIYSFPSMRPEYGLDIVTIVFIMLTSHRDSQCKTRTTTEWLQGHTLFVDCPVALTLFCKWVSRIVIISLNASWTELNRKNT